MKDDLYIYDEDEDSKFLLKFTYNKESEYCLTVITNDPDDEEEDILFELDKSEAKDIYIWLGRKLNGRSK